MRTLLVALLAAAALSGCSTPYIMSTRSGAMIQTSDEPYLDAKAGMYRYRTIDGKEASIRKEEVVEILER